MFTETTYCRSVGKQNRGKKYMNDMTQNRSDGAYKSSYRRDILLFNNLESYLFYMVFSVWHLSFEMWHDLCKKKGGNRFVFVGYRKKKT